MQKKVPIFWLSISLFYLLFEVTFRADLLNLAATSADQNQMANMETLGRFIASVGFAIFIASFFKKSDQGFATFIKYRRSSMVVAFFVSYFSFSWFQQFVVETYARGVSDSDKREMLLASVFRDVLYVNEVNKNGSAQDWLTPSIKTTLALTPLMSFSNPKIETIGAQFEKHSKNVEPLKLKLNQHYSDPRVFNAYRVFMYKIIDNYSLARIDNDDMYDMSNIPIRDTIPLYDGVIQRANYKFGVLENRELQSVNVTEERYIDAVAEVIFHNTPPDKSPQDIEFDLKKILTLKFANNEFSDNPIGKLWLDSHHHIVNSIDQNFYTKNIYYAFYSDDHEKNKQFDELRTKYFGISHNLADICTVKPDSKSEFEVIMSPNPNYSKIYPYMLTKGPRGTTMVDYYTDKDVGEMFKYITGRNMREPHLISCDLSFAKQKNNIAKLDAFFRKTSLTSNPEIFNYLKKQTFEVRRQHFMYKALAVDALSEIMAQKGKGLLLRRFATLDDYLEFISSVDLSSASAFKKSIHNYYRREFRTSFVNEMRKEGLDFSSSISLLPRDTSYMRTHVMEDPNFQRVFQDSWSFVFNKDGSFLLQELPQGANDLRKALKEIPEARKVKIRQWYADRITQQQARFVDDPSLFSKNEKNQKYGESIAKGFIAPGFVLLISNIMITITIVNVLMMALAPFIRHAKTSAAIVVFGLLFIPPYFIKNSYLYNNLPSASNPRIVKLTSYTANNQILYDMIFPEIVQPNLMYEVIKRYHAKEERLLPTM